MSHVNSGEVVILADGIADLTVAAETFGGKLVKKSNYNWFGRSVGDHPLPKGMTKEDLGKCEYAIQLPGVRYEVGVVRQKDGNYTLAHDSWGNANLQDKRSWYPFDVCHDGEKLVAAFGKGLNKLSMAYTEARVRREARAKGYFVKHLGVRADGSISLQLVGR